MCGIASIWNWSGAAIPSIRLYAMSKAQQHRGPDGHGYAIWNYPAESHQPSLWYGTVQETPDLHLETIRIGLAHNWLAIQDISPKGRQPMTFESQRYWIIFNGEIYNFLELRDNLRQAGIEFASSSDTEVLLALWCQGGPAVLSQLRGMFAFVIYDCEQDILWAVRDRFGIKPLYYAILPGQTGIVIASEFRGIHASGLIPRRWNESVVKAFLAAGITKPGETITFFEGVYELPPGCLLEVHPGQVQMRRYYDPPRINSPALGQEGLPELRKRFLEVIELHLRSLREVGTCMSGGLDSTNIAYAISQILGEQAARFATFTIGASESDDVVLASQVAEFAGLQHHVLVSPEVMNLDTLVDLVIACETPSHFWGPINQYLLLSQIHTEYGLHVLLDGQGGDEVFSAYPWFFPFIDRFVRDQHDQETADLFHASFYAKPPFPEALLRIVQQMFTSRRGWLRIHASGAIQALGVTVDEVLEWEPVQYYLPDDPDWAGLYDQEIYRRVLPYLLRQEDRIGMWFSIENRVPFLDHEFANFVIGLDPLFLVGQGYLKYPLRLLFPEIAEPIRFNRKKRGYWENHSNVPNLLPIVQTALRCSETLSALLPNPHVINELKPLALWRLFQMVVLDAGDTREDGTNWLKKILNNNELAQSH
jgi:asparagine synthase (glutamine-hydrolysing)